MFAFQSPIITRLHKSRSVFLPLHRPYQPLQISSLKLVRLSARCAFDTPSETSSVAETSPYSILSDATVVTIQLPLDIYLEETTDGRVFIDEIIQGGSAQASALLCEGDIIVAVSLPFGDGLFPVPDTHALEMIASHIATREGHSFTLAVVRTEPVEQLRSKLSDNLQTSSAISKMQSLVQEIYIPEYPIELPDKEDILTSDKNFIPDLEALREYGFELDDILNAPDYES